MGANIHEEDTVAEIKTDVEASIRSDSGVEIKVIIMTEAKDVD